MKNMFWITCAVAFLASCLAGSRANAATGDLPAITRTVVFQDFDHWGATPPSHPWGGPGKGYQRNNWKNPCNDMAPTLDATWKDEGAYSLRFDYTIADCNSKGALAEKIVATGNFYENRGDWREFDGFRFVIKPDGSGQPFDYWILDPPHDIRHAYFVPTGTEPVMVYIPWKTYRAQATDKWLANVNEEVWTVGGPPAGKGHFWVDSQAVFKGSAPLAGVAVIPAAPMSTPIRIDAGNYTTPFEDGSARHWRPDIGYVASENVRPSEQVLAAPGAPIEGTTASQMYLTARKAPASYHLPVANGTYTVRLHFAEIDPAITMAGQRVFDVRVNDRAVPGVDIFKAAGGPRRPVIKTVRVTVTTGMLNIVFTAKAGVPLISGIEIL